MVKAVVVSGFEGTRKQIDKLCADVEVQAGGRLFQDIQPAVGHGEGIVAELQLPGLLPKLIHGEVHDPAELILLLVHMVGAEEAQTASGAVRNHDPEIMIEAFRLVRLGEDDVKSKFPAMYNAFCYGAPPHAGAAPGIDRMIMLLTGEESIREVITFPMNQKAQDLMMDAPSSEGLDHDLRVMVPHRAGGGLIPVADQIILERGDTQRVSCTSLSRKKRKNNCLRPRRHITCGGGVVLIVVDLGRVSKTLTFPSVP